MFRRRSLITALTSLLLFVLLLHIKQSRDERRPRQQQLLSDAVSRSHVVTADDEPVNQYPSLGKNQRPASHNDPSYIFAFGDSYTTYGFDSTLSPPSISKPHGNRVPLPSNSSTPSDAASLVTSTPKWLDYLITDRTLSPQGTIAWNFARGASTIDGSIVPPQFWGAKALVDQAEEWVQSVAETDAWKEGNAGERMKERTVFVIWFGINDVANTAGGRDKGELESLYERVVKSYVGVLERFYDKGGRNLAVLGFPPIGRTPQFLAMGPPHTTSIEQAENIFSRLLEEQVTQWAASKPSATVMILDVQTAFTRLLDAEPENAKCTTAEKETCLWIDRFHPAPSMQRAVAAEFSSSLRRMGVWA